MIETIVYGITPAYEEDGIKKIDITIAFQEDMDLLFCGQDIKIISKSVVDVTT